MSIYVPSTPTFHPHVLRCGRHRRSTLTASAGTGMVRLAVVPCLHARARSPGGAKQPYGVRPARTLPGQRAAAVSLSAADFAGEMGPVEHYANAKAITGRAGL